jgi:hypothetical protein
LVVAHSLAVVGGALGAAGAAKPMVDLISDDDEDVKPAVKNEGQWRQQQQRRRTLQQWSRRRRALWRWRRYRILD